MSEGQRHNRLIGEKSPYLIKHASNPVDWYPWGEEAFESARASDRPVFLSVGYSTCHWCNVMEEESFSDPGVAALMNRAFVSIKVDREERPDIDAIYMAVCQMLTGSGGWPLTVIMTPDRKPFYAGTYFPKESRFGRIGMVELVPRIEEFWRSRRGEVLGSAESITSALREAASRAPGGEELGPDAMDAAYRELREDFDSQRGGFGQGIKFPMPHNLLFLLRHWKRTGRADALEMATKTLSEMRRGGIFDQLGFGFHRYSTDPEWLVPHFEKMLYDQAMLALAYIEAYQATGTPEFADTAKEIFAFMLREMVSPEGGFYSAQSADTEGVEGKFYLWRAGEVEAALGREDAALAFKAFGIMEEGNFVDQFKGERTGENVLHLAAPFAELAASVGVSEEAIRARLEAIRGRLFEARLGRARPDTDDKVLADWNGMMTAALARGAWVLSDKGCLDAARKAADFVLGHLRGPDGRLLHRYREGEAAVPANAADYACLIWGLIELYEAGFDPRHLDAALGLMREFIDGFWDDVGRGFHFTHRSGEAHIVRIKEAVDSAIPSSNSVAAMDLLRLARLTGDTGLEEKASHLFRSFSQAVMESPSAHTMMLSALSTALGPSSEVVIAGRRGAGDTEAMLRALRTRYMPDMVLLLRPAGEEGAEMVKLTGFLKDMDTKDERALAYVCRNFRCDLPATEPEEMLKALEA